jgi:hypothetical protein
MFILDDPDSPASWDLPHSTASDIPLIVQDRDLSDSGELRTGNVGDMLLVNGTFGPFLDVTAEVIRLRLLNASNARVYDFGFYDDRGFPWSVAMAECCRRRSTCIAWPCRQVSAPRSSSGCAPVRRWCCAPTSPTSA